VARLGDLPAEAFDYERERFPGFLQHLQRKGSLSAGHYASLSRGLRKLMIYDRSQEAERAQRARTESRRDLDQAARSEAGRRLGSIGRDEREFLLNRFGISEHMRENHPGEAADQLHDRLAAEIRRATE